MISNIAIRWLFCILLILLFIPALKLSSVNFYLFDVFIVILCLCIISMQNRHKLSFLTVFFAIIFFYLPGSIFSPYPLEFFPAAAQLVFCSLLLFIAHNLSRLEVIDESHIQSTITIAITLLNIFSFMLYFDLIEYQQKLTWVAGRFCSVFNNPNLFAKILLLNLSFLLFLRPLKGIINVINAVVIIFFIFTTGSISGIIFSLVLFAFFFLRSGITVKAILSAFLVVFFISGIQFFDSIQDDYRFIKRINNVDSISSAGSASEKIDQINYSVGLFLNKPIFGHGLENGKYFNNISFEIHGEPVSFHFYLSTLAVEGGIFILIMYGFLIFLFFKNTQREHRFILIFFIICFSLSTNIIERFVFLYPSILVLLNEIRIKDRIFSL